jgi:hypothetical protein
VRDDDIARDELDEEADRHAQQRQARRSPRAAVPVPPQALERRHRAPVVGVEAIGPFEGRRARELPQHLALARPADVELVEEGRDRSVVASEQLEPLERVVVELRELLLRRRLR